MTYTEVDIDTLDIDWFGTNQIGQICHFATGGGIWPPRPVRDRRFENEELLRFVNGLPEKYMAVRISDIKSRKPSATNEDMYFSSFEEMARRGIFSFDIYKRSDAHAIYLCVAAPDAAFLNINAIPSAPQLLRDVVIREQAFFLGQEVLVGE